ncbi:hypothetical protein HaLaN_17931, partial [Haematococcus lacustris]
QVQELQAELALHDSMSGRQSMAYAAYTDQQRDTLREQADRTAALSGWTRSTAVATAAGESAASAG